MTSVSSQPQAASESRACDREDDSRGGREPLRTRVGTKPGLGRASFPVPGAPGLTAGVPREEGRGAARTRGGSWRHGHFVQLLEHSRRSGSAGVYSFGEKGSMFCVCALATARSGRWLRLSPPHELPGRGVGGPKSEGEAPSRQKPHGAAGGHTRGPWLPTRGSVPLPAAQGPAGKGSGVGVGGLGWSGVGPRQCRGHQREFQKPALGLPSHVGRTKPGAG